MVIRYLDYSECTLCQVCVNICPKECIKLKFFKDGFEYPTINEEECMGCKKCKNVCPVLNKLSTNQSLKETYAAKNLNENIRKNSSSGGFFSAIAENIFDEKGYIVGAAFDKNLKVEHIMINNKEQLHKIRGSKYVQSYMGDIYKNIREQLKIENKVLFSGCPCQVAGLKKFLGKEYEYFYTVYFICHGIPSQFTFDKYISYLEKKYNSKVKEFLFRDKSNGWHNYNVKITMINGKAYSKRAIDNAYMRGFLGNIYLKKSCHNCKYRNLTSGSDLTIGDYWGAEVEEREIDDDKGLSLVIVNSEKGRNLINSIKNQVFLKKIDFDIATKYNQRVFSSCKENICRRDFFYTAEKSGYDKAFTKYCELPKLEKLKNIIRCNLSKIKQSINRRG